MKLIALLSSPESGQTLEKGAGLKEKLRAVAGEIVRRKNLRTALRNAYLALPPDKKALVCPHSGDLSHIIKMLVLQAHKTPYLTQMTLDEPEVAVARLFHLDKAKGRTRKHDKTELQSDHDERVTEASIAAHYGRYGRWPVVSSVIKKLLHDSKEDYGVSTEQIAAVFNQNIADAIDRVSTPPYPRLMEMYPELGDNKPALKSRYQIENVATYDFYDCELKHHDGMDALTSYCRNMRNHDILIVQDPSQVGTICEGVKIFSETRMHGNFEYRARFHRLIINRLHEIQDNPILNPENLDCAKIATDFGYDFCEASSAFTIQLGKARKSLPSFTARHQRAFRQRYIPTLRSVMSSMMLL